MTESTPTELEPVVDEALERALRAPQLPHEFRARLSAALSRTAEVDLSTVRERLESEQRRQLQALESQYLRVRRGTLGSLLGVAFTAGAATVIALPWLREHLGAYAIAAVAWGGVALVLGIAFLEPLSALLRRWSDVL